VGWGQKGGGGVLLGPQPLCQVEEVKTPARGGGQLEKGGINLTGAIAVIEYRIRRGGEKVKKNRQRDGENRFGKLGRKRPERKARNYSANNRSL